MELWYNICKNGGEIMPRKDSISEKMMYATLRLYDPVRKSSATGFIYTFEVNGIQLHGLITNRHFAEGVKDLSELDFTKQTLDQRIQTRLHVDADEIVDVDMVVSWVLHSKEDLAFTNLKNVFENVKLKSGKGVVFAPIIEAYVPTQERLEKLSAIEDVIMVGYPNGLYDEIHNFPIFRKGITSSHPSVDHNGKKHGLVDMACLPGSSGSPIFILNEGSYNNKSGGLVVGTRFIFLGIQNSMPVRTSLSLYKKTTNSITGETTYSKTDDYAVSDDLNLGMYIKSSELEEFKKLIAMVNPPKQ